MSFIELKLADLRKVADTFGVDASEAKTKPEVIALLEEEGINYQMYAKFNESDKQDIEVPEFEKKKRENKVVKNQPTVLVKMERDNHSYQTNGYSFTQEHPFVVMPEEHAQAIFDTQKGFRLATPREAQEYYG